MYGQMEVRTFTLKLLPLFAPTEDPMFLICKRGDLLLVDRDGQQAPDEKWIRATNQRTNSSGAVYKNNVQFLPTLTKPTEEDLVQFSLHPTENDC